jgi:hypothetical protein
MVHVICGSTVDNLIELEVCGFVGNAYASHLPTIKQVPRGGLVKYSFKSNFAWPSKHFMRQLYHQVHEERELMEKEDSLKFV